MNPSKLHSCPLCQKVMLKKNLYTHLRVIHKSSPEEVLHVQEQIAKDVEAKGEGTVICPICNVRCAIFESLAKHCEEAHSEDGAEGLRKTTTLDLGLLTARKNIRCNRAGVYKTKATQRAAVSKKDVQYCSCFVTVQFYKDGKHSLDYVIKRVRNEDSSKLSRVCYIVKQDLRNIIAQYNMMPGWRHEDDVTSTQIRYDEKKHDDGIRAFEPPDQNGRGFLMVIITPLMLGWLRQFSSKGVTLGDTFHTTRYNVRLATLMVPDDKDRGLPGAFLLSGSMTTDDVRRLFVEIRSLMPEFSPRTLVTDEAPCFFKGFRAVFPDSATRLHYCTYHVRQAWERKTKELVEVSIRPTVNSALHGILKETQLAEFQRRFAEILVYLRAKKLGPMADYLKKKLSGIAVAL
ncbi:unnamed protein product [Heligmosomoides polygyrus]|uniref:C2H2-type domain-containing protein n=1 Tax=Heligmosomoides polygyrus TaxID=6339 RepID=A0A183FA62_HELPZ|nr:unnamed protein product [Heligmosomoides polygyrus]